MGKFISLTGLSEFLTKCKALFYTKPNSGIPKTDLASGVQSSLDLADSSVQANPVGSVTPAVDPYDYATREEFSQLGQEVDATEKAVVTITTNNPSDFPLRDYSIQSSGRYNTTGAYKHILIPCNSGDVFTVRANNLLDARYAFLTTDVAPISGGNAPILDGTSLTFIASGDSAVVPIPLGAKFLYIYLGKEDESYPYTPQTIVKYENILSSDVENLKEGSEVYDDIDLSLYPLLDYVILSTNVWGSNSSYKHIIVPVSAGDKYRIISGANYNSTVAFLTDDSCVPGNSAPVVSGTTRTVINAGEQEVITIPETTSYLYLYSGSTATGTGRGSLPKLEKATQLNEVVYRNNEQIKNIEKKFVRVTREISIDMELGFLSSTGEVAYTTGSSLRNEKNLKYLRSSLFLNLVAGDTINSIDLLSGETCKIYCFDASFALISSVGYTENMALPQNTAWVKLQVYNASGISATHSLLLSISKHGEVKTAYNKHTNGQSVLFVFEVKRPIDSQSINADEYVGNNERIWDTGYLCLPENYSQNGAPVPLVLTLHGTGGMPFSSAPTYTEFHTAFTKNGYAVADCSGITSYFATTFYNNKVEGLVDSKCNPLLFSCLSSLVAFLKKNYNISDGVFIHSKSAGGLASAYLAYNAPFKVKAIASFAPALVMAGQSFRVTGQIPLNFWLARLGYDSPNVSQNLSGEGDLDYVLANSRNLIGFEPLFIGTDVEYDTVLGRMFSIEPSGSGTRSEMLANAYSSDGELMGFFDSAKKYVPVPIKFWCAADDDAIPYMWVEKFVQMASRANGKCYLRTMPSNTGGHHSVDNSENAIHTNYLCKNGEIIDIPVAYAEMIDWFEQWV